MHNDIFAVVDMMMPMCMLSMRMFCRALSSDVQLSGV